MLDEAEADHLVQREAVRRVGHVARVLAVAEDGLSARRPVVGVYVKVVELELYEVLGDPLLPLLEQRSLPDKVVLLVEFDLKGSPDLRKRR
jgi:hypothetical protein